MAWIDCVARGRNFARGIFIQGEHDENPGALTPLAKAKFVLPFDLPAFALNRSSVGAFNALYYHKRIKKQHSGLTDYEPFFYPLDRILQWNRLYGQQGLLQFQCVLPWAGDSHGDGSAIEGDYRIRAGFFPGCASRSLVMWLRLE